MKKSITILTALAVCLTTMSVAMAGSSAKHSSSRGSASKGKTRSAGKSAHQGRQSARSGGRNQRHGGHSAAGSRAGRPNMAGRSQRSYVRGKSTGHKTRANSGRKSAGSASRTQSKGGHNAGRRQAGMHNNKAGRNQRNNAHGKSNGRNTGAKHNLNNRKSAKSGHANALNHGKATKSTQYRSFSTIYRDIPYTITAGGFLIGGTDAVLLAGGYELDPGDTIVSVGDVDCSDSTMDLADLVDEAQEDGNLVMVVRQGISGKRVEVELVSSEDAD